MAELKITGLDDRLVRAIERHAEATHRTVDEVARDLLKLGLLHDSEGRVAAAARIRAMTPSPIHDDSTEIIRRLRDSR